MIPKVPGSIAPGDAGGRTAKKGPKACNGRRGSGVFRRMKRTLVALAFVGGCRGEASRATAPVEDPAPVVEVDAGAPDAAAPDAAVPDTPPGARRVMLPVSPRGVSFDKDGKTVRVDLSDRLAFHDFATLVKQRELVYPPGTWLVVDQGENVLLGGAGFFICNAARLGCVPLPKPLGASSDEDASMSPSGRLVVFGDREGAVPWTVGVRVYDTFSKTWSRRVSGVAPVSAAGGIMQLCGMTETHAEWCHTRDPAVHDQDLRTGAFRKTKPRSKTWKAVTNHGPGGPNAVELTGPGPSRWVEEDEKQLAPFATTCGASNRALVTRAVPARIELRELPRWELVMAWPVAANVAACSPDGRRVAWLTDAQTYGFLNVAE